jgi:hypothetical protein
MRTSEQRGRWPHIKLPLRAISQAVIGAVVAYAGASVVSILAGLGCWQNRPIVGLFFFSSVVLALLGVRFRAARASSWAAAVVFVFFGVWVLAAGLVPQDCQL